jgi:hypothetical protein
LGCYKENGSLDTIQILLPAKSFFLASFGLSIERKFNFPQDYKTKPGLAIDDISITLSLKQNGQL